jgi:hypothetical protein
MPASKLKLLARAMEKSFRQDLQDEQDEEKKHQAA